MPINSENYELKNIATYEKYQGKGYGEYDSMVCRI
jgi:hypothetical protein